MVVDGTMEDSTNIISASGNGAFVGFDNSFSEDFTSTIYIGVLPMKDGRTGLKEKKNDGAAAVIHETAT